MTHQNRARGRPKSFRRPDETPRIQAVDRAVDVLEALAMGGTMTLSALAAEMGQSPATLYRILTTFQLRGLVENIEATQEWMIGANSFRIGAVYLRRSNIVSRAMPAMRELMAATGETANLGIEADGRVMFIAQVETHESIRAFFPPGTQGPMHASGIGKALLATYAQARMQKLLGSMALEQFTAQTLTRQHDLRADLAATRTRGYAIDDGEKSPGMRCIAAPIFNYLGEAVAGISVSGPSNRLTTDKVATTGAMVKAAADGVSEALGADTGNIWLGNLDSNQD
ncbi:MAG: HTH-type transcriptional regulator BhcR [Paracoccaceae bacterium]